jgi:uncharacterized protein (DUF302 family)
MMDPDGMSCWVSAYGMEETLRRLHLKLGQSGMTIFAEIDQASAAAAAGLTLLPMRLLIFGDPAVETPLLLAAPTAGIDLPLKMLVWTDAAGSVWLAYNDIGWIAARHRSRRGNHQALASMRESLPSIAASVTGLDAGVK